MKSIVACIALCITMLLNSVLAGELSEQAFGKLQNVEGFSGEFQQSKQFIEIHFPIISKGVFTFDKENGLTWNTQEPVESSMQISKDGVSTSEQRKIAGSELVGELMLQLMSGELSELNQYFSFEYSGLPLNWTVILTPKTEILSSIYKRIELDGAEFILGMRLFETSGNQTKISFSNYLIIEE